MPEKYPARLEITTRIGCRINCVYCPQKLLATRYGETSEGDPITEMSFETFQKCIDKTPTDTRIDFSGMAEPWLNKDCTKMVQYAAEKGHPIAVYTTLIGMTEEDFSILKTIPMEQFVLHIPDDKSNSHIEVTQEYISLLEEAIHATRSGEPIVTGYSCHAGIHPQIINKIPKDGKLIQELYDRAGNVKEDEWVKPVHRSGQIVCINCGTEVNHNVLLPDGRVVLCCMDYGLQHILGNLLTESWEEIHNGPEAKTVKSGFLDEGKNTLCRACSNAKNICEMYDELCLFRDWTQGLLKNEKWRIQLEKDYKKQEDSHAKLAGAYAALESDYKKQEQELQEMRASIFYKGIALQRKIRKHWKK